MTGGEVDENERRFMGSLEKAFQVLEAFNLAQKPLRLGDVARLSGVERSATQRVLFTLKRIGYVRQDPDTRLYSLSPRMLMFGNTYMMSDRVRETAAPILQSLSVECEETVNLTELEGLDVIYVLRFPSRHSVSVNLSVGSRLPAYCTAPGRAILAHLPQAEVEQLLRRSELVRRTPFTNADTLAITRHLKKVRAEGYSLSNQEAFVGDISVSSPVFDEKGLVAAAVNIAVPVSRWSVEDVEKTLAPLVVSVARQISGSLRGSVLSIAGAY